MEQIIENKLKSFLLPERKWLSHVIWQLVIGQNLVAKGEYPYLHEAMNWVTEADHKGVKGGYGRKNFSCICPLELAQKNRAFQMFAVLVEVALLDRELAIVDMGIIEKSMSLLGFDGESKILILSFAEELNQNPKPMGLLDSKHKILSKLAE